MLGDLVEQDEQQSRWTNLYPLGATFLDEDHHQWLTQHHLPPPHVPVQLRAGSCWLAPDALSVYEYLGRYNPGDGHKLMFRAWDSPTPIGIGSCVHLSPRTPSRGGGTDFLLDYADIWPNSLAARFILDPEEPVYDGTTPTVAHSVIAIFSQLAPTLPSPPSTNPSVADIVGQARRLNLLPGTFDIYTDG